MDKMTGTKTNPEPGQPGDVDIPDKMFFKIRDVAKIVEVKPHVLRYWESEFPSFTPQKNRNGQRMYTRKDVEMALEIRRLLHHERYSIAGARNRLKRKRNLDSQPIDVIKSVRRELGDLLKTLDKKP